MENISNTELLKYTNAVNTVEKYIQNTEIIFSKAKQIAPDRFGNLEKKLQEAIHVLKENVDYYPEK